MSFRIEMKGLDATVKKVESLAANLKRDIQDELNAFAIEVSSTAKRLAPADEGHLRGAINPVFGTNLEASIVVTVVYAAFMEFGTRKFAAQYVATLPADWQRYAATFKGRGGGDFDQFLKAIMAWVKRKGIDDAAAYPIAMKILREGVRPRPYLYPAIQQHLPELKTRLKAIIK
jgi:hypothetical protein